MNVALTEGTRALLWFVVIVPSFKSPIKCKYPMFLFVASSSHHGHGRSSHSEPYAGAYGDQRNAYEMRQHKV